MLFSMLIAISICSAQKSQSDIKTGYIVAVVTGWGEKPNVKKTQKPDLVNSIVEKYFTDLNFNVLVHMSNSNRFIIETDTKTLYVEKKRINKKGKYRRIKL